MFMSPVYAKENIESKYRIENGYIIDQNGHKYTGFYNGAGEEVSLEEALAILNADEESQEAYNAIVDGEEMIETKGAVVGVTGVDITSLNKKYVGKAEKVTPDLAGPGNIKYGESRSVGYSISVSFTGSVQNAIMKTIGIEFGVTVTDSTAYTKEINASYDVPAGKIGAVYFKPYYVRAAGSYNDGNSSESFVALYPKVLDNGFADGLYYLYTY